MVQDQQTFRAAEIGKVFKHACTRFDNLLAASKSQELTAIRDRLREELKEYKQQGALSVAFIGQYSAGKSTIISALTGRRDIHIDADIATDQTSTYEWNEIKLIDTPGLFTDRQDHDEITYRAIAKADLLVFCLTHMLFDSLTVANFKKLAYEKGYRWKMMLVINKMSSGAGEDDQKVVHYRHSLSEALKPYSLNEFPISFIDAKDYCDGVDEGDSFFTEISRFDTFISELNQFVERRAALTRFDTPIRIVLGCLDDAQIGFTRNSGEDTAFLEVLNRLSRRVHKERERLRTKVKSITLEMTAAIASEGTRLALAVGDSNFEDLNKQSEINVRKQYEKAGEALEEAVEHAIESIRLEVESELQSNLTQTFVAQLNFTSTVSAQNPKVQFNAEQLKGQIGWLQQIGEQVGAQLTKSATREFAKTAGQGFLRSMDVAGSGLHQTVYAVGKLIGFKFQPWQAVGIAKGIGNAAMFLGPALNLISVGMDMYSLHQEREYEQKMSNVRQDITSQFQSIAVDLKQQIEEQLRQVETQVYGQIEKKISEARQQTEGAISASSSEVNQLTEIRKDLESLLTIIQQVATSANNLS
jgi:hypothetical protein